MIRRFVPILIAVALAAGCASTSKLSEKSEKKLATGDAWNAWRLATRALEKEPGNPRARSAATAAGTSIVEEWQRRIRATALTDSVAAAEDVLKLNEFRSAAARYATIPVSDKWTTEDLAIRGAAARIHYQRGLGAAISKRPKKACDEFTEADRYVPGYRDAVERADRALDEALTRVAVVPFRALSNDPTLGVQVARAWRDDLVEDLAPPNARFTRVLAGNAVERDLRVSELDNLSREEAVRLGRVRGAQRVVWGTVGAVKSSTHLDLFKDTVCRRVVERNRAGVEETHWVDVPIEVVARVRDVTVPVDYEVIETKTGTTLTHRHFDRATTARVVWTSQSLEGEPSSYSLVSEPVRAANPDRAAQIEKKWASVCGTATTIAQVVEARHKEGNRSMRESASRWVAGAAFVFLEDLPGANDMAFAALTQGASPLRDDLLRLDPIDDADLGVAEGEYRGR